MPRLLPASVCPRCRRFVPLGRCDVCLAADEAFVASAIQVANPSGDGLIEPEMLSGPAVVPQRDNPHTADAAPGGMPVAATPGRLMWFTHHPRPGILLSGILAPLHTD